MRFGAEFLYHKGREWFGKLSFSLPMRRYTRAIYICDDNRLPWAACKEPNIDRASTRIAKLKIYLSQGGSRSQGTWTALGTCALSTKRDRGTLHGHSTSGIPDVNTPPDGHLFHTARALHDL